MSFTDDELNLLASVPQMIGTAMAAASGSGLIGTGKEAFANAGAVLEGLKSYPGNALIKSLIPDPTVDRQAAIEKMTKTRDWVAARFKANGVNNAATLTQQVLADTRAAASLLNSKASPKEAQEYRDWTMAIAEKVANAATEGGFLGFGGERLSAPEKALLDQLRTALGGPATA
jgi:hypothetical protein